MRRILLVVAVLGALAYWGTLVLGTGPDADAATKPSSSVHCLVFRWALINGTHWVLLDQKPLGEIPCPRTREA